MKMIPVLLLAAACCMMAPAVQAEDGKTLYPERKPGSNATITSGMLMKGKIPGVEFRGDVTFLSPGRKEKLDVYLPEKREPGKKYPGILMIHGGGWVGGDKAARRELIMGSAFAQSGYVAVSVEYDKTHSKSWPTNLKDCKNAVRWMRKNAEELQLDPDHIGVIGGSAGGHLSLMVAFTPGVEGLEPEQPYPGTTSTVQCCVNLYGITDLTTRCLSDDNGVPLHGRIKNAGMLSKTLEEDPDLWKRSSPVTYVTSQTVPTLTLHGEKDTTVDRDQAKELDAKMKAAGAEHKLVMIPGIGHAFSPDDKGLPRDMRLDVINWFDEHLKK